MTCGDKFKHMAVTADGQTLDSSISPFPSTSDYDNWKELARSLAVAANDRLNALADVECRASGGSNCGTSQATGSFPEWNKLVDLNNKISEAYDDLPWFTWLAPPVSIFAGIEEAKLVVRDALCLLELADDAIIEYTTPDLPTRDIDSDRPSSGWKWALGIAGGVIAIGGMTLLVAKLRKPPRVANPRKKRKAKRARKANEEEVPIETIEIEDEYSENPRRRGKKIKHRNPGQWEEMGPQVHVLFTPIRYIDADGKSREREIALRVDGRDGEWRVDKKTHSAFPFEAIDAGRGFSSELEGKQFAERFVQLANEQQTLTPDTGRRYAANTGKPREKSKVAA